MASYSRMMSRLLRQLRKCDHRLFGAEDGFGDLGIVNDRYELVVGSPVWIEDYLKGLITAADIGKALTARTTPYEAAAEPPIAPSPAVRDGRHSSTSNDDHDRRHPTTARSSRSGTSANGIRLAIRTTADEAAQAAINAAIDARFPSDGSGLVWVNAAINGAALAAVVARLVWYTVGAYCPVMVEIGPSAAMPDGAASEVFTLGADDYLRLANLNNGVERQRLKGQNNGKTEHVT